MTKAGNGSIEFVFEGFGETERQALQGEIKASIADIRSGDYASQLEALGVSADALAELEGDRFKVGSPQQLTGLEAAVILIAVKAGVKLTERALTDIWKGIVFPRLKKRYGGRVRQRA